MPELRELQRGVLGRGKESQQDPSQSVVNSGDYLKGYGNYKEEYAKEKVTYLVIDIDSFGIKNYYIEFIPKYNDAVWRNQTKG